MADVHMEGSLPHSEDHVWLHPQGSLAALPLPAPGTWRLFVEVTRQRDGLPLRPVVLFNGVPDPTDLCDRLRVLAVDAYVVEDTRTDSSARAESVLVDIHGDFAALYGFRRNFICLIRPDGHIGLIQASSQVQSLSRYLGRICDPAEVQRVFDAGRVMNNLH